MKYKEIISEKSFQAFSNHLSQLKNINEKVLLLCQKSA